MKQIPINYHPIHRSGCSLKKDAQLGYGHIYGPVDFYGSEVITLYCGFEGIKEIPTSFQLFTVDSDIDYNSFYSLN